MQGPWYITRAQVAATMRYAIPVGEVNYVAASGSTLRFKAAATKSIGASSVTSTLETGAGSASVFTLLVEDVGV